MKTAGCIGALLLTVMLLHADGSPGELQTFNPQKYPEQWFLATNRDGTVTATEYAIRRQGDEVFRRVMTLRSILDEPGMVSRFADAMAQGVTVSLEKFAVMGGLQEDLRHAASEADIRRFIRQYQPPSVPYTSEATAERTGRRKFNCVEFAEDLVAKARARGIPAELVGILFAGETTGHACASFPTADGQVLYFDSTPGMGEISWRAQEAHVVVGEPYERSGGGELAVVGRCPITQIMPDLNRLEPSAGSNVDESNAAWSLVVTGTSRVQVAGIQYAGPDTLQVSAAQLLKWNWAEQSLLAARTIVR